MDELTGLGRLSIQLVTERSPTNLQTIREGMRRYNLQFVPDETYDDVTFLLRNPAGDLRGAALGETGRGWLNLGVIWVDHCIRGKGLGKQLLEAIEAEAIRRGCHAAFLDTFSYQAKPFYEKSGYEVFGRLPDYPRGHTRFFMMKQLTVIGN